MQNVLPCRIDTDSLADSINQGNNSHKGIAIDNLGYKRGTAEILIDHLIIEPGIYAVTGANGESLVNFSHLASNSMILITYCFNQI
jgi:hypothetical protein